LLAGLAIAMRLAALTDWRRISSERFWRAAGAGASYPVS